MLLKMNINSNNTTQEQTEDKPDEKKRWAEHILFTNTSRHAVVGK